MRLVVDMNLSPQWIGFLSKAGHQAAHWSQLGDPRAPDAAIMEWAREHKAVVFTHDLDFSRTLALTGTSGPSVIQLRAQDVSPAGSGGAIMRALDRFEQELAAGALVVIDATRQRIRILPLQN
jgi:predicted nuclease of predicted toxin-antitoxin system